MIKVALLNDTTRDIGHWGCNHVIQNINTLCHEHNCEIYLYDRNTDKDFDYKEFKEQINPADIVLLNGEGTLHDNAGSNWLKKAAIAKDLNKKTFLVNSVWQNNTQTKNYLQIFDICTFREAFSYNEAIQDGCKNAIKIPDLTFYSWPTLKELPHHPQKKIGIIDSTKKDITSELIKLSILYKSDLFFMYLKHWKKYQRDIRYLFQRNKNFKHLEKAEQLTDYETLISGRFHACCMSLMLGIPTISIESNTWKIKSMLQDAELEQLFHATSTQEAYTLYQQLTPEILNQWQQKSKEFSLSAYKTISIFWNNLF